MRIGLHRGAEAKLCVLLGWTLLFLVGSVLWRPTLHAQEATPATTGVGESGSVQQWQQRLHEGSLSAEEISAGVALALRAQADNSTRWDTGWGDFVEAVRSAGKLSDELWRDYLLGAVRFKIRVATQTRRSTGLPIFIEQEAARTGRNGPSALAVGLRTDSLSGISLQPNGHPSQDDMKLQSGGGEGLGWTEKLQQERYASLQPGPQTYRYRYRIQVYDSAGANHGAATLLGERVVQGIIPWRLLAEDEARSLPVLQEDPVLRPAVEKSMRVSYLLRDERDRTLVQAMIQVDRPPTTMAFEMSLRGGGETWPLGPVAWEKGKIGWWVFDTDLPENLKQVDVVLTPSAAAGARLATMDPFRIMEMEAIWSGPEIVIPNVQVRSQRVSMQEEAMPEKEAAIEYALEQLNPQGAAYAQVNRDRKVENARLLMERRVREHAEDSQARYELGCLLMAERKFSDAMEQFVAARQSESAGSLSCQIQKQQRRLGAHWLYGAKAGEAPAMCALARAYEHGWGVGLDTQQAKRWYRNAANIGYAEAMYRLAAMYEHKTGALVTNAEADEWYRVEASAWYRKAAAAGVEEAKQWLEKHP